MFLKIFKVLNKFEWFIFCIMYYIGLKLMVKFKKKKKMFKIIFCVEILLFNSVLVLL